MIGVERLRDAYFGRTGPLNSERKFNHKMIKVFISSHRKKKKKKKRAEISSHPVTYSAAAYFYPKPFPECSLYSPEPN